ncbi:MAG: efflux transporter outer membrane subunit [Alphaproteobacteria bacterium]|nr:efflux transporter outer membrane subunit [Alphaproteobacteria bacterium]
MILALLALTAPAAVPEPLGPEDIAFDDLSEGAPLAGPWWTTFGDPALDALIDEALSSNHDLASARERVRQAEALSLQAAARLSPTASFDVTASGQPAKTAFRCAVGPIDPAQLTNADTASGLCWTGSAQLVAAWPVDWTGRQWFQSEAARHDLRASRADADQAALLLSTTVAEAWLDVVAADQRLLRLGEQLEAQSALLEVLELRYGQGGTGGVEVLQQRQAVSATRATLPVARSLRRTRAQALAVLLGRDPAQVPEIAAELPEPSPTPDAGSAEELVERRPDLRAARERLEAADARHTSATLALLPSLRLNAAAGWQYAVGTELTTIDVWSIGGAVSVPLFNGGLLHGQVKQASGAEAAAVHAFDQALLGASRDVRAALVLEEERDQQLAATRDQVEAARLAWDSSRDRFLEGLEPYLTVLVAQNAVQAAELQLVQAHRDRLGARVQLHSALGGPLVGVSP